MKAFTTLSLFLLTATGILAQINPDNMFIDGYVLDTNGQAVANHQVCIAYVSNNPALPSDTTCTSTNANGYYAIEVQNGSVTGPNVNFEVSTEDPCAFVPLTEVVSNGQGTVDTATVNFIVCANNSCNGLVPQIGVVVDSAQLICTFSASAIGGTPGYAYEWGGTLTNQQGNPVIYQASPGDIVYPCLTVTDTNGCTASTCMPVYVGQGTGGCSASIQLDSSQFGPVLVATGTGTPPLSYTWDTGDSTAQIGGLTPYNTYCVTISDSTGCTSTECFFYGDCNGLAPQIGVVVDSTLLLCTFSASATGGTPGYTYEWGGMLTNQQGNPVTYQASTGDIVYPCLTVTDTNGCTASTCMPVYVGQGPGGGCSVSIQLDSSQFGPVLVAMGTGTPPFTYVWNTGQTTAQIGGLTPDSTYCVTIWDSTGCTSTECFYYDNPPSCDASFTTTGPDSLGEYTFTADVQNIGWNYLWTADNIIVSSVSVFQTTFPNGVHEICLTVTDSVDNCTETQCETFFVGDCNASFSTVGPTPTGGFTFTADIQNVGWDYSWTADNLIISSVSTAQTTLSNGVHEVCLTVTDSVNNCTNTQCQTITVGGCDASFTTLGPDSLGEYTFSADVQNIGWNYTWTANNTVVSSVSVFQSSLTNGVNEVCLIVSDPVNNCSDTACQTITVGNNCFGYLTGEVYAGTNNQPLDAGVVYLITLDLQTNQLVAVDSMVLDTSNYYYFGPLACADYLVKAASYPSSQYYSNYIPTYYGNSPFWGFAQAISLSQTNPQVNADITLIAANNPGGPGFIGGDVTEGANKTDPGDPLSGMQVMLFNLNGGAIAYAYTDQNGEFGFDNLVWGTYQVYVEVLGVQTIPAIVTIGPEQPSVDDVHIFVTDELITTGIEEFDFEAAIGEVYPNPVGSDAAINFNLESGATVDVSVVDLAGRTVSTRTISVAGGENTVRISAEELNGGYYLLSIQDVDGNFSVTRKFMRVD